jgi:large subunit ribosomal protein L23
VKAVHTLRVASKPKRVGRVVGRRAGWKKAIITLADGASIEFYETEAKAEGQGE